MVEQGSTLPLTQRLIFVTGKGGVGKSTVAAALGLSSAATGAKTLICELVGSGHIQTMFGLKSRHDGRRQLRQLSRNLSHTVLDQERALSEWIAEIVGSERLAKTLTASSSFRYFAAAAPGAYELATLKKLERLLSCKEEAFDRIVIDAPASGHSLGLLQVPERYRDLFEGSGAIKEALNQTSALLKDRETTAYVAVTTAEQLPITELLETTAQLEKIGIQPDLICVNQLFEGVLSQKTLTEASQLLQRKKTVKDPAKSLIETAILQDKQYRSQQQQLSYLLEHYRGTAKISYLPLILDFSSGRQLVETLSELLD